MDQSLQNPNSLTFVSPVKCVETWTVWSWETLWSTRWLKEKETKSVLRRLPKWHQVRALRSQLLPILKGQQEEKKKMPLVTSTVLPPAVNAIGDDVSATVMMGKVIRPLRSVDPSQTDYQGLIEVTEEGWCCCGVQPVLCHF